MVGRTAARVVSVAQSVSKRLGRVHYITRGFRKPLHLPRKKPPSAHGFGKPHQNYLAEANCSKDDTWSWSGRMTG